MVTLKSILNSLKPEQYKQLMYAFENGFEQYITLPNNKFIGVNVKNIKHLWILKSAGDWSYGDIQHED